MWVFVIKKFDIKYDKVYTIAYMTTLAQNKTKTSINLKIDKSLKMAIDDFVDRVNIPLSTMINSFLKKVVREQSFSTDFTFLPTEETISSILQTEKEIKEKVLKTYSVSDFQKKLKNLSR
jgi:addiction module RelB/DinJ family antitoxin